MSATRKAGHRKRLKIVEQNLKALNDSGIIIRSLVALYFILGRSQFDSEILTNDTERSIHILPFKDSRTQACSFICKIFQSTNTCWFTIWLL